MFDLLIKNALIIDGGGQLGWSGDLAVQDGRIAALEPRIEAQAAQTIEAKGQALCPGFIDPHSHWDSVYLQPGQAEGKLRQGVMLDLVGNCGESLAPASPESARELKQLFGSQAGQVAERSFADYTAQVDDAAPGLNVMSHVGHGTLRVMAMGHKAGPPDEREMGLMKKELARALEQGAAGMSTGLYYTPSGYAQADELRELMQVVADKGGFHASHIRNEAEGIKQALEEVIEPGLACGAPTHISHLKMAGRENWSKCDQMIEVLERGRQKGLDLTCDVYPYDRSSTTILSLIPPWAREGGIAGLLKRLGSPGQREAIREQMRHGAPGWESSLRNAGFEGITISSVHSGQRKDLEGVTLAKAAEQAGRDPFDYTLDLVVEQSGAINVICSSMCEENVAQLIKLPFAMIGSDGSPSQGRAHPRTYGAFPRVIRRFVRELGILSLEEAVAKMSGMTAARLNLKDRGLLKKGMRADMLIFDPQTFSDQATFENPKTYATGLQWLFIEGGPVITPEGMGHNAPGGFVPAPGQ